MSSRMGRPKSDNPKSVKLTVRLDKERVSTLKEYCEQENIERGEAVRRAIDKIGSDIKK